MDLRRVVPSLLTLALMLFVLAPTGVLAEDTSGGRPVVVQVSDGFHWRDAALGAAAGVAVVLVGAGLVLTKQKN